MTAPVIDIALVARGGARAPFPMHDADGILIGACETIRLTGDGRLLLSGWTTRAEVDVCCGADLLPASVGEPRDGVASEGAAREFEALVPRCGSGFLVLRGSDGEDAFQWRSHRE